MIKEILLVLIMESYFKNASSFQLLMLEDNLNCTSWSQRLLRVQLLLYNANISSKLKLKETTVRNLRILIHDSVVAGFISSTHIYDIRQIRTILEYGRFYIL